MSIETRIESISLASCHYCKYANEKDLVKCLACKNYFCNARSRSHTSHVVYHLIKCKHKEISLHKNSPVQGAKVECQRCGTTNVFMLGYVYTEETVMAFICRSCSPEHISTMPQLSKPQWFPIIDDRCIVDWLVAVPPQREMNIEEQRDTTLPKVKLSYKNTKEYCSIMQNLIEAEAQHDKALKQRQTQENVCVRWSRTDRTQLLFVLTKVDVDVRIAVGDEVRVTYGTMEAKGYVKSVPPLLSDEITVEVTSIGTQKDETEKKRKRKEGKPKQEGEKGEPKTEAGRPSTKTAAKKTEELKLPRHDEITRECTVHFVWKSAPYDRMKRALRDLTRNKFNPTMAETLISGRVKNTEGTKAVPLDTSKLNLSQRKALDSTLRNTITLIQGPPGTGKTLTSANVVLNLVRNGKVLVCAPSNVAVDQLTLRIAQLGINVVRIVSKNKEEVDENIKHLTQKALVSNSKKKSLRHVLNSVEVVTTTCVGAGDRKLRSVPFKYVVIDEATQATEPLTLVPMSHATEKIVLVGDHLQLGPVILDKGVCKSGLWMSLFERIVRNGFVPVRLTVQYRMHPCLSEFPSNVFYDGTLQNGVLYSERRPNQLFPWPDKNNPMFFMNCVGSEELSSSGTSFLNRIEAFECERIVRKMISSGISPSEIGVITPYEGQRAYIVQQLSVFEGASVEVASVDAFQGREKNYVILSCVRSNLRQGIGFLNDTRRLNVALTRARYGLILLGNAYVLRNYRMWYFLLKHFSEKGLFLEGTIESYKAGETNFVNEVWDNERDEESNESVFTQNFTR